MSRRISWKKGMRLTDEIFKRSDNCTDTLIGNALALSAAGRFGLFPNSRPFKLSVDINKNIVDVVSIDCLGLTRDGSLIDVCYDSSYTSSFDTRAMIPSADENLKYLLCISTTDEWRDINDGYCERSNSFTLIEENSFVQPNSLPIARIVFDGYSWRMDDVDFLPPCLYISSINRYSEMASQFLQILSSIDSILPKRLKTGKNDALKIFWPTVQQLYLTMDKEQDLMTPMSLLANIQKFISAFACGCTLDEYIELSEPEVYADYIRTPYSYKNAYLRIREGIELCRSIYTKVENFVEIEPEPEVQPAPSIPAPTLSPNQLQQNTRSNRVKIAVNDLAPGATLFYSTDGSEPSLQARDNIITLNMRFRPVSEPEPDVQVTLKMKCSLNGTMSSTNTFTVNVTKDYKHYICI